MSAVFQPVRKGGAAVFTPMTVAGVTPTPGNTRTVRIVFGNAGGTAANLKNLSVAFYDEKLPHLLGTPKYQSGVETTDGDGALDFSFISTLAVGDQGYLIVEGPDGAHYNGKWVVS